MIDRTEALGLLAAHAGTMNFVELPLSDINGHVLAKDLLAAITAPPADMSAMDGYAIRFADLSERNGAFRVIGEAAAGAPFSRRIGETEAVRVFTGSVIPDGADHVVIQEDVVLGDGQIRIQAPQERPRNIRRTGIDFSKGDRLIPAGTRLGAMQLAVAAGAQHATLCVRRKPKIVILANGNELILPGTPTGPASVICSTPFGLAQLIRDWGGEPVFAGIARDSEASIIEHIDRFRDADVIVPLGGASVGDHDHMKSAFAACGLTPVFSKIAVQPGKPTWFGLLDETRVLGLPGNPASALVCAILFLNPLIAKMLSTDDRQTEILAELTDDLPANGSRENFLRGRIVPGTDGMARVTPANNQDSSLLSPFLTANALIQRAPHAPAAAAGSRVHCISFKS